MPAGGLGEVIAQCVRSQGGVVTSYGEGELFSAWAAAIPLTASVVPSTSPAFALTAYRSQSISVDDVVGSLAGVSGQLYMSAIPILAGTVVSNLSYVTGSTAAVTPTHQWAALFDLNRNMLAASADGLAAAIAANTVIAYPIATTAAGAATSFTTTYTGLYYIGVLVNAGTQPTLACGPVYTGTAVANLAPTMSFMGGTGLTAVQAFPYQPAVTSTNTGSHILVMIS